MKPKLLLLAVLLPITVFAQKITETVKDTKIVFTTISYHPKKTAAELFQSFRTYLADSYNGNGIGLWDRIIPNQFYSTVKTTLIFNPPNNREQIISVDYTLELTFKDNELDYCYKNIRYERDADHISNMDIAELRQDKMGLGKTKLDQYRQYTLTGLEKNVSDIDKYIEKAMVGKRTIQPELIMDPSITIPDVSSNVPKSPPSNSTSQLNYLTSNRVDVLPQYPGGKVVLDKYISDHLKYGLDLPQGRIVVKFIVQQDGQVNNIRIVRGLCTDCDQDILNVIKSLPKWKPAEKDNKPVSAEMIYLVNYQPKSR